MREIILDATTSTLQIKLGVAVTTTQVGREVYWEDDDGLGGITTGTASGNTNNTTPVTIVTAPPSGTTRTMKAVSIYNNDSTEAKVTISRNDNGVIKALIRKTFPSLLIFSTGDWENIIGGNVIGDTVSIDGHFVVFEGTSGKRIRDGGAIPTGIPGFLETLAFAVSGEVGDITTGTAKITFRVPYDMTISSIKASLNVASTSGTPTFDINVDTVSILSTKLTIDEGEKTSVTAAVPAVLTTTTLTADQEITIDIDVAGTGAVGAKIYIIGHQ